MVFVGAEVLKKYRAPTQGGVIRRTAITSNCVTPASVGPARSELSTPAFVTPGVIVEIAPSERDP